MSNELKNSDVSSSNNNNKKMDQNKLYIIISTAVILLVVILFLVFSNSNKKNNNNPGSNSAVQTTQFKILNEQGNFDETIDATFKPVRNLKFGTSLKKIRKAEKKLKDTDEGSLAEAQDGSGYSYLTYHFVEGSGEIPQFFGGTINPSAPGSSLMYVLKDKKLIEVRILFGSSTPENYDSIVASNTAEYGQPNLVRSYSNGTKTTFWRTKDIMLGLYSQYEQNGTYTISIYFSKID